MSQLGDLYMRVFRKPGDTVLIQCLLDRGDQYLAYLGASASQYDQLGVDDMDEDGNGLAYLKSHFRQQPDSVLITVVGGSHDGFAHFFRAVDNFQAGYLSGPDLFHCPMGNDTQGRFCLQAAPFAAFAKGVALRNGNMAQFTGIAG